jgi:uncharacterized membrane protein
MLFDDNYLSRILAKSTKDISAAEKRVLEHFHKKEPISHNVNDDVAEELTVGQKIADKVAAFGGSWPFIGIFAAFLIIWIGVNSTILLFHAKPFDPYPYILLNLFLSMIAAIQAPIIMMSQNRHAMRDRLDALHDYEVNLKAELEIHALHDKIDALKAELEIEKLHEKLDALSRIVSEMAAINKEVL